MRAELQQAMHATKNNTGMLLNVALNYSGRAEIVDTFNRILLWNSNKTGTSLLSAKN